MAQSITLQTSDSDIVSSDVLGRLSFAASSESSGSDAVLIGASIYAMAESNFTEISNATSIIFATASSESAIAKLKISSQGHFLPILDKTYDIGASGTKFRNVFAENGKFENISISNLSDPYEILYITDSSGNVSSTDLLKVDVANTEIDLGGDLIPTSNLAYDLGSSSYKFRDTYTDKVILNSGSAIPATTSNTVYNVSGELYYNNNVVALLPSGGVQGQILQKYSTTSNILEWIDNFATEVRVYVKNTTGSALTKGQAVYINGAQGDHPTIALAIADGESSSSKTLGLLKQNLAINEFGYVVAEGALDGIDTSAASAAGDLIYLSPTTPGGLVYGLANRPTAPNHMVFIGYVVVKQQNNGKVFIKVQNGFELGELHNVATNGTANGTFLQYNTASGLWLASTSGNFTTLQLNGTTVSVTGHTHTSSDITNFNSSVSGLLPTIANSGDNRILTSTGSSVGINAEANLTFNGSLLNVVGSGSFSSQTVFASGTAAAPGISILGDTDTGLCQISSVGTNSLSISTSGVERVRFASNGDVQINTGRTISGGTGGALFGNNGINNDFVSTGRAAALSAGWATLRVNQVAAYVGLRLVGDTSQTASYMEVENSSGTNLFTINSAGNIGVGTSSPSTKLQINGQTRVTDGTTNIDFVSSSAVGYIGTQTNHPLVLRTNDIERMRITSGGNLEIKSNAGNISTLFTYNENGGELVHYDDAQVAATLLDQCANSTRLLELINGSDLILGLGGSNSTGSIRFMRAGYNEAMRIDSTGAVGIGTSNPSTPLHVVSFATSDANKATVMLEGTVATSQSFAGIRFKHNVYTTGWGADILAIDSPNFNAHLTFRTTSGGTNTSSPVERMRITSDGNVGIGTASVSSGFRIDIRGRLLSYTTASDGLITVQGLQTESAGTGKAAIQIDVNGKGGFAWQNDASSGTRSLRLLENSGYGASDATVFSFIGGAFTFNRRVDITQGTTTGAQTHFYVRPENGALGRDSQITLGCTFSNGWGGADYAARDAGAIRFGANGGSADPRDWSMRFLVADGPAGSDTPRECMRITAGGNVGIGTSTVSYRLHVVGNASAANNVVCYLNNTGGTRSRLAFQDTSTTYAPDISSIGNDIVFDTVGIQRMRIGNNGRTQFFAATEKYGVQLNNGSTGNGPFIGSDGADIFCISTAGGAERLRVNAAGELLIGTTTDNGAYLLQVNSQIYATNATIATSDSRFKTNVVSINNATSIIQLLRPVSFDFIPQTDRNFSSDRQIGLIAQEVQEVLSNTDYKDSIVAQCGDHFGLAYEKLVPLLIKALQETNQELQNIKNRLSILEGE